MTKSQLIFWILVFLMVSPVSGNLLSVTNDDLKLEIKIISGDYLDADGDGLENDVITTFAMKIETVDGDPLEDSLLNDNIGIEMYLRLPSGKFFKYEYSADLFFDLAFEGQLDQSRAKMSILVYFHDHAIESGDYTYEIIVYMDNFENHDNVASFTFDPPGGTGGDFPPPYLIQY